MGSKSDSLDRGVIFFYLGPNKKKQLIFKHPWAHITLLMMLRATLQLLQIEFG